MKRILWVAAAISINAAVFIPAQASTPVGLDIVIGNAPPPVRYEAVPAPRRGYEWAPGYWNWSGNHHVWVKGHWEHEHSGQHYYHPEWQQTEKGWRLNPGGWRAGDRDGDGVPNRQDNHPDDPRRN